MKIYLVSGASRHGKDTTGDFIEKIYLEKGIKVCRTQIAKYMKMYVKDYFGWDGREETKPRKILQQLGTDLIREKMNKPFFFINRTIEDIEVLSNFFDVIIITDIRIPIEIEKIKERFDDVVSINVKRINFETEMDAIESSHKIENQMNDYDNYDYRLINDTLENLEKQVIDIVREEEK